jgi:flagellar biosynthesis protein FlhA
MLFGLVPGFPTGILMTMGLMISALGYTIIMIDKGEDNIVTRFFKPQVTKKIEKPADLKEKKRAAAKL